MKANSKNVEELLKEVNMIRVLADNLEANIVSSEFNRKFDETTVNSAKEIIEQARKIYKALR